jgi:NAD(P)-dependent dehydrogenase (short-subunit alcohol dehydrogenase family)
MKQENAHAMPHLTSRIAVITGAKKGIGFEIAR